MRRSWLSGENRVMPRCEELVRKRTSSEHGSIMARTREGKKRDNEIVWKVGSFIHRVSI